MPNYTFRNKTTGEVLELSMSISDRESFVRSNPELEQVLGGFGIGDSIRLGLRKPDSAFRDILKKAKSSHRGSNINTF